MVTGLSAKDGFTFAVTIRDAYVGLSKTPEQRAKEEAQKQEKEREAGELTKATFSRYVCTRTVLFYIC